MADRQLEFALRVEAALDQFAASVRGWWVVLLSPTQVGGEMRLGPHLFKTKAKAHKYARLIGTHRATVCPAEEIDPFARWEKFYLVQRPRKKGGPR